MEGRGERECVCVCVRERERERDRERRGRKGAAGGGCVWGGGGGEEDKREEYWREIKREERHAHTPTTFVFADDTYISVIMGDYESEPYLTLLL